MSPRRWTPRASRGHHRPGADRAGVRGNRTIQVEGRRPGGPDGPDMAATSPLGLGRGSKDRVVGRSGSSRRWQDLHAERTCASESQEARRTSGTKEAHERTFQVCGARTEGGLDLPAPPPL